MANILVTGGAGYVRSHACKALAEAGYTPIAYDNLVSGHPWAVRWGPLEKGDIGDRSRLDKVISRYKPEAVMHFAAYAYARESVQNPNCSFPKPSRGCFCFNCGCSISYEKSWMISKIPFIRNTNQACLGVASATL